MPTAFCLHALGASSEEFALLRIELVDDLDVVAIDLPGFGRTPASAGTTVEEMAVHVERAIGSSGVTDWLLVGHSMGGKIATVVADRTMSGANGLFGLRGVVLLAASPLAPEPMDEDRRQVMLGWAADGPIAAEDAAAFVAANTASPLPAELHAVAVRDVERADPAAWTAWLTRGSREDWSAVPVNPVPALVLAGAEDGDLDADAQRRLTLPHWSDAELHVVDGAAHLLPWEHPAPVAERIRAFVRGRLTNGPVVPAEHARLIASPRVSARTRGILAVRALPDDPTAAPEALTPEQLDTLRQVARIVVPQPGDHRVDLALRVDAQLAAGLGDGWRPDGLPVDVDAYRAALDLLAVPARDGDLDRALDDVAAGRFRTDVTSDAAARDAAARDATSRDASAPEVLTPAQLRSWFEDASVDLVKQWLAHPATMAAIDFDGYANGGDGVRLQGFQLLGAGTREAWEPTTTTEGRTTTTEGRTTRTTGAAR
ncbi:alpha/beta fold hydrolase [Curtobacterium sp. PhB115]|uniref:alpha/beta fold hydrolase n=1 Tax=Curtobacterium sp. PhB115 TaxID=2485173 RepID=UPI000F4B73A2|nr:alpha/beta hydrolase [Curtobacterium sp. PhB115]ROP58696.1 pimeloyl-ACP methyl ester carboxylesterase [Curtobacterium sp. PhB115]